MKRLAKLLLCLLTSAALSELAVEIYVHWYVARGGGPRSDYSNDYGMAFDAIIVQLFVFIASAIAGYLLLRKR